MATWRLREDKGYDRPTQLVRVKLGANRPRDLRAYLLPTVSYCLDTLTFERMTNQ